MNDTSPMSLYKMDSGQTVLSVSLFQSHLRPMYRSSSLLLHYLAQIARPSLVVVIDAALMYKTWWLLRGFSSDNRPRRLKRNGFQRFCLLLAQKSCSTEKEPKA